MLEKEEKLYINPKTGKTEWVVVKKGLFNKPSKTPAYDSMRQQIKEKQSAVQKQKWDNRKKTYKKWAKRANTALDWIEGTNTSKKKKSPTRTHQKQYIVKNGVAYPVYRQKTRKTQVKKKNNVNDPFDLRIHW